MGFPLIFKTALLVFVLGVILVNDTLHKSIYNQIKSLLGIGTKPRHTNDSCLEREIIADPDDITFFYQCFWAEDPTCECHYWHIMHLECPSGSYFNQARGVCAENFEE
ncbi:uncharacterized protein LOC110859573 [Folsomia candida]|uniref:uncharacterized protein LOC110859573 n=1 Tax=Folsomia candida TaxID=158441 RepID=UPI000B8F403D|nr:uncharacterized protein LOC110859573 [Folsomia candida]